jgi:hypothetical protein
VEYRNHPILGGELVIVKICKHCGREIVPTEYETWGDRDNPGYEVCELADDYGPSHEPEDEE